MSAMPRSTDSTSEMREITFSTKKVTKRAPLQLSDDQPPRQRQNPRDICLLSLLVIESSHRCTPQGVKLLSSGKGSTAAETGISRTFYAVDLLALGRPWPMER